MTRLALPVALALASLAPTQDGEIARLAQRCGSEVAWAQSWQAATDRARAENRLILAYVHRYRGFQIPDTANVTIFMSPRVVELIGSRFVPLRLTDDVPAPIRAQDEYGMGPLMFGAGILLCTPGGEVVRETQTRHPAAVYGFLVDAIERCTERVLPPADVDGAKQAEWLIQRGELEAAHARVADLESERAHQLRAAIAMRRFDVETALASLQSAGDTNDRWLAELELHLRRKDFPAAARAAKRVQGEPPQAQFWRGIVAICQNQPKRAERLWSTLIERHPDDRWAWHAAAYLQAGLHQRDEPLQTEWPARALLDTARIPDFMPGDASDIDTLRGRAITALLESQRDDGSWIAPSELHGAPRHHPFVIATSAIAAQSLFPHRDVEAVDAALHRAVDFVLEHVQKGMDDPLPESFMDYTVWSDTFALWFLADCREADYGNRARIGQMMRKLVTDLRKRQKPSGGWSYYRTNDLSKEASPQTQAMSFTSAVTTIALQRAAETGIYVPKKTMGRALRCLERGRNLDGTFSYMVGHTQSTQQQLAAGSCGRNPICELALLRGERSEPKRVHEALEYFEKHRATIDKERGKVLMHAGSEGQGCHYVMFDYATAARAAAALPAEQRDQHRSWLFELVLAARTADGRYLGSPINGTAFGTAMALIAFDQLQP